MSLDVYLNIKGAQHLPEKNIPVREDGQLKMMSRAEWDKRFPDRKPITIVAEPDNDVYTANITHNLTVMAAEAGIYMPLWRPDEVGIETAEQLIEPLRAGLELLESDTERFEKLNPENGWGDYEGLVEFMRKYLAACEKYPQAEVSVWR
jgi:hypothetical protein